MLPSLNSGLFLGAPIFIILLFSSPNSIWYLPAISFVIFSIVCSSLGSGEMRTTSSIHNRHPIFSSRLGMNVPSLFSVISLFISSMSRAYWATDSTQPWRMLSLILISLVMPYFVMIVAVISLFIFLMTSHSGDVSPSLCITYIMASSQALSYALVTSRNAMYTGLFLRLISPTVSFSNSMWSLVALPFWPRLGFRWCLSLGLFLRSGLFRTPCRYY